MTDMKTNAAEWEALNHSSSSFLFCTRNTELAAQLNAALGALGPSKPELPEAAALAQRLQENRPRIVFIDFTFPPGQAHRLEQAMDLAQLAKQSGITCIAVGYRTQPESTLAALRARVSDFVDPHAAPQEAHDAVQSVIEQLEQAVPKQSVLQSIVLIGARPGVGATTLAVHLASLTQVHLRELAAGRASMGVAKRPQAADLNVATLSLRDRACILDLAWPIGDSLLYLNMSSGFDFVEAVRNVRRLDQTMLAAALAHDATGVSVLSRPQDSALMRTISLPDSLRLCERLHEQFGILITDASTSSTPEFLGGLARLSPQFWIITDQSVGSLVSLSESIETLETQGVPRKQLRLIVGRYDDRYGLSAAQIAARFELDLLGVLPDRTAALMASMSQGKLLSSSAPRDPYVKAVQSLLQPCLQASASAAGGGGGRASWLAGVWPALARKLS